MTRALVAASALLLILASPAPAQEIVQAVLLDLTVVEVHVIVAAARPDDRVQCLVRAGEEKIRTVVERVVSSGLTSGRTTIISLPLPLLDRDEREFAVVLLRANAELARTTWRPIR